jgi:hypothetical protein
MTWLVTLAVAVLLPLLSREPSSESVKEGFALCVGRRVGIGRGAGVNWGE